MVAYTCSLYVQAVKLSHIFWSIVSTIYLILIITLYEVKVFLYCPTFVFVCVYTACTS